MFALKKLWYRIYQIAQAIVARFANFKKAPRIEGAGCSDQIPQILKKEKVSKVLVVTGKHVGKSIAPPIIEKIMADGIECVHYDQVEANPTTTKVYEIRDLFNKEKCNGIIAIGGGSPIDASKAAAALIARPKKSCNSLAGILKVMKKIVPFIAVPTTSGTGSETTFAAVITDAETHHKYPIMDPVLIPKYAVLDPLLTVDLPQKTTSATGMDALTHAVESYLCTSNYTHDTVLFAEEATKLIFGYLERAYKDGNDVEARAKMQEAAYLAGWSFGRAGVGNVHAIAHTLGGLYNTPHGLANAVILPIVLEDYGPKAYKKLARLSEITGLMTSGTEEEKAKRFIKEVYDMNERMGIPRHLDVIEEKDIPTIITWALKECNPTYPVPVIYDETRCRKVINEIIG